MFALTIGVEITEEGLCLFSHLQRSVLSALFSSLTNVAAIQSVLNILSCLVQPTGAPILICALLGECNQQQLGAKKTN
ncbi:hypothetical protein CWB98_11555 [Pseudoalteromonas rubra]|uniref:Uncharacterized protein n=1 Tax=Pseudoalteromonas rubra TaxID=43658 RepID=A0A5S3WZL5_9GAMM|nr:hypothetical protein CWB98_11555 [Pseudoalteromonas rubra]